MSLMTNGALPEVCSCTVRPALVEPTPWDPKLRLVGLMVRIGAAPVPSSGIICGLPAAFSVTVSVPVRLPTALGVNVTLTWQPEKGAIVVPLGLQLTPPTAKLPDADALTLVTGSDPLLKTATSSAVLVVPSRCLPKF